MCGYAYIQWKIALAHMQDANMAEMTQQGGVPLLLRG
jgi:hypothetical protein